MKQYFIDLLQTLKEINENLKWLKKCVYVSTRDGRHYIATGHWNDRP